jgi:hypothetical protein
MLFLPFFLNAACAFAQAPPEFDRWAQSWNGRFILSGAIVDENGQSMNGVTVEMERTPPLAAFVETKPVMETQIVNGTFRFDVRANKVITLTFKREGYYVEQLRFEFPKSSLTADQLTGKKEIQEQSLIKENIRVVMEMTGPLTHLSRYHEALDYNAAGAGVVIDLDRPHHLHKSLRSVGNIHDASQLPPYCVYMIADKDAEGKIAVARKPRPDSQVADVVPQRVRLLINGADAGFVKYTPNPNKRMTRQMKMAPDGGYQREVVITGDDFAEGGQRGGALFYFRTKDKYGKGGTGWVKVAPDRTSLEMAVVLSVQPNGSRLLAEAEE